MKPPPGVEVIEPTTPGGITLWRWWPRGTRTQVELWLCPASPGQREASVVLDAGHRRFTDPADVAVVEDMFVAARGWLTAQRANDGRQLDLPMEAS